MNQVRSIAVFAALGMAACGHGSVARRPAPDPLATASAAMLLERGRAFAAAGDSIRAEQYLVAAASRGASDRDVLPALLAVCIRGQRYGAALRHVERYLARRPNDRALLQLSAVLYLSTGSPERARVALERVVKAAPDEPEPRYLLARAHRELGQPRRAAPQLRRYLSLEPGGSQAREAKAWLRARRAARRHKWRGR